MKRILLSDFHKTPFREVKFESQKFSVGEWIIQVLSGKKKSKATLQKARDFIKKNQVSFFISDGDLMEAQNTERGWSGERDKEEAIKSLRCLESYLGTKGVHNIGNHELGYILPLTTDARAGISQKSIRTTLEVYGRDNLYHSFVHEGHRFMFLPYLFAEEEAVDFDLGILKQELLADILHDLLKDEPVIIFLHDPDALCYRPLLGLLRIFKNKVRMVFCGHLHASEIMSIFCTLIKIQNSIFGAWLVGIIFLLTWAAFDFRIAKKIRRYLIERKKLPGLVKEFSVEVIPAPGGMLGMGGGFLVLNIHEKSLSVERHKS